MEIVKGVITRKTRKVLWVTISFFAVLVMALSSIAMYFTFNGGRRDPLMDPLEWSVDTWEGESPSGLGYVSNYADRGNDTITIDSAESFIQFVELVNMGVTYRDRIIYLNKSIDFGGREIDSIGTMTRPFEGTFDGSYYTLMNVKIKGDGLFGVTKGATIKNVGLYDAKINSTSDFSGGLIGRAIDTNIENSFVRLGSINGKTVGGLVGLFESNNGYHSISQSFADTTLKGDTNGGLIGKLEVDDINNKVFIKYSYYDIVDKAVANTVESDLLVTESVIKAKGSGDFANWNYSSKYDLSKTWCDYDRAEDSRKLKFDYPILTLFVKVYLTGTAYDSVVKIGDEAYNVASVEEAFTKLEAGKDAVITFLGKTETKIDNVVEVPENSKLTLKAFNDSKLIRGEENEDCFIYVPETSKLVLGIRGAGEDAPVLTIDGNAEYVVENNKLSGPLVVANGPVEIHDGVTLCNNANTYTEENNNTPVRATSVRPMEDINAGPAGDSWGTGGGLLTTANVEMTGGTITSCTAQYGGGVFVNGHVFTMSGGSIDSCGATLGGGAAYVQEGSTMNFTGGSLYNNAASQYGGSLLIRRATLNMSGDGTATHIANCGKAVTINGISFGATAYGGGICLWDATTGNFSGGVISDCSVSAYGGAIDLHYNSTANITHVSIWDTHAQYGGGIFLTDTSTCTITDIYINESSASEAGGAIYADQGATTLTINNCTITNCGANYGGAIQVYTGSGTGSTFNLKGGTISNCGNISVATASNITHTYTACQGGAVRVAGGATFNMSGGTISSCTAIYGGGVLVIESSSNMTMSGGTIDNCAATSGGGGGVTLADADNTLEMSGGTISNCTAVGGGGAVSMNDGVKGFSMSGNAKISGCTSSGNGGAVYFGSPHASSIHGITGGTISGCSTTGNGGAIYVQSDNNMSISGVTISDCSAGVDAGAIFVNGATVTLGDVSISGCKSTAEQCSGGAISLHGSSSLTLGSTTLGNPTISNCQAGTGGAIAIYFSSTCTMNSGTISNCTATYDRGGAINVGHNSTDHANATFNMYGGTIENCTAQIYAGAIAVSEGRSITINNATIINNTATSHGNDVHLNSGVTLNATGSTITSVNSAESTASAITMKIANSNIGTIALNNTTDVINVTASMPSVTKLVLASAVNTAKLNTTTALVTYASGVTPDVSDFYVSSYSVKAGSSLGSSYNSQCLYLRSAANVARIGSTYYTSLASAVSAASGGDTIYITDNIVLDSQITISQSLTLRADTKNVTIKRSPTFTENMFYMANSVVSLRLGVNTTDTSGYYTLTIDGNGEYFEAQNTTTGSMFYIYSDIYIYNYATLANNYAENGGAIYTHGYASNFSTVYISGGTIRDCTASVNGGAICAHDYSNIKMYSGYINNCTAKFGGAICSDEYATYTTSQTNTITLTGGIISDCSATRGGAIYSYEYSEIHIGMSTGSITNCTASSYGGAIYIDNHTSLRLVSGSITNCTASRGGAIYVTSYSFAIFGADSESGPTILDCTASSCGGAICISASNFTYVSGIITNCTASTYGGAIYIASSTTRRSLITIYGGTISDCSAASGSGGAIYSCGTSSYQHSINISGGTITNCTASTYGGAIYCYQYTALTISGGIVENCTARSGGAVYSVGYSSSYQNTINISGGTITGCTGNSYGGAIYIESATNITISGGTITECSSKTNGGAIYISHSTQNSTLIMNGGSISGCTTGNYGGAIYCNQTLTLNGGTIEGCSTTATSAGGGAIYYTSSGKQVVLSDDFNFIDNVSASGKGNDIYTYNTKIQFVTTANGSSLEADDIDIYTRFTTTTYATSAYTVVGSYPARTRTINFTFYSTTDRGYFLNQTSRALVTKTDGDYICEGLTFAVSGYGVYPGNVMNAAKGSTSYALNSWYLASTISNVYTVSLGVNDSTLGTLSKSSAQIYSGVTYTTSGNTLTFSDGVVVTATPQGGYATSWSSTSGTISGATTITANFVKDTSVAGVARIGTTYYDTLAAAFSASTDGDTIYVRENVLLNSPITVTTRVTLTADNGDITIKANATMTQMFLISNTYNEAYKFIIADNDSYHLTIDGNNLATYGIYFASTTAGYDPYIIINGGTLQNFKTCGIYTQHVPVEINGGTVHGVHMYSYLDDFAGTYQNSVTVNGGQVYDINLLGGNSANRAVIPVLNIAGGIIEGITLSGATMTISNSAQINGTITIDNMDFNFDEGGLNHRATIAYNAVITGSPSITLVDGADQYYNADSASATQLIIVNGTDASVFGLTNKGYAIGSDGYLIVKLAEVVYVSDEGLEDHYTTLELALAAVEENGTIYIRKNLTSTTTVNITKNVTFAADQGDVTISAPFKLGKYIEEEMAGTLESDYLPIVLTIGQTSDQYNITFTNTISSAEYIGILGGRASDLVLNKGVIKGELLDLYNVTINDGTVNNKITSDYEWYSTTLTINGGVIGDYSLDLKTVNNDSSGNYEYFIAFQKVIMNGGTIQNVSMLNAYNEGYTNSYAHVKGIITAGTFNMNGGTITNCHVSACEEEFLFDYYNYTPGEAYAVVYCQNFDIKGGTITACSGVKGDAIYTLGDGSYYIYGSGINIQNTIYFDTGFDGSSIETNIAALSSTIKFEFANADKYVSEHKAIAYPYEGEAPDTISWVVEGYVVYSEGEVGAIYLANLPPVAKITRTGETYTDLQSAINAASADTEDTIEILENIELTAMIVVNKNMTIRASQKNVTITSKVNGSADNYMLQVTNGATLIIGSSTTDQYQITFTYDSSASNYGKTIYVGDGTASRLVVNKADIYYIDPYIYSNLIINGGTIDKINNGDGDVSGDVVINGGTVGSFITSKGPSASFKMYGGTVDSVSLDDYDGDFDVEVSGGTIGSLYSETSMRMSGGTVTGTLTVEPGSYDNMSFDLTGGNIKHLQTWGYPGGSSANTAISGSGVTIEDVYVAESGTVSINSDSISITNSVDVYCCGTINLAADANINKIILHNYTCATVSVGAELTKTYTLELDDENNTIKDYYLNTDNGMIWYSTGVNPDGNDFYLEGYDFKSGAWKNATKSESDSNTYNVQALYLVSPVYVAEVDGVQYTDLQGAIDKADSGDTVYLIDDVTLVYPVNVTKNVSIMAKYANRTITAGYSMSELFIIESGVTLNGGDYTLTIDGNSLATCAINFYSGSGTVTINKTNIQGAVNAIKNSSYNSVVINSGTISGQLATSCVTINGGTINGNILAGDGGSVTITGGTINGYVECGASGPASLTITGGVINSTGNYDILMSTGYGSDWLKITGTDTITDTYRVYYDEDGAISSFVDKDIKVIDGMTNAATKFTCVNDNVVIASDGILYSKIEARIGDRTYGRLTQAISAATSGDTIYILNDITLTESININKNLTISADTKDVTISAGSDLTQVDGGYGQVIPLFNISAKADITFSGSGNTLTLDGNNRNTTIVFTGGYQSNVTMNAGVVVTGVSSVIATYYMSNTLTCAGATFTYSGDIINDQGDMGGHFVMSSGIINGDLCAFAGGTITISGGTINGYVQIGRTSPGRLTITGGTFNNTLDYDIYMNMELASNGTITNGDWAYITGADTITNTYRMKYNDSYIDQYATLDFQAIRGMTDATKFVCVNDGYIITADGYVGVDPSVAVAKVGDRYFKSIQDADNAAANLSDRTIYILKDITEYTVANISYATKIMPYDKNISAESTMLNINNNCTITGGDYTLTLDTISSTSYSYTVTIQDGVTVLYGLSCSTVIIEGGIINDFVNAGEGGSVTISGGTINCSVTLGFNGPASLTITGGTINSSGDYDIYYNGYFDSSFAITGSDSLTDTYRVKCTDDVLNAFAGSTNKLVKGMTNAAAHFTCVNECYMITADGYLKRDYAARIGTAHYGSLETAVQEASAEDVIYILKDITLADTLTIDKALTFAADTKDVTLDGRIVVKDTTLTLGSTTSDTYQVTYTSSTPYSIFSFASYYDYRGNTELIINKAIIDGQAGAGISTGCCSMQGHNVRMNGGTITNCSTGIYGGSETAIIINGGTISYCNVGIAIPATDYCSLYMNGGTITGCDVGIEDNYNEIMEYHGATISGGTINNSITTDIRGIGTVRFGDNITDVYNIALTESEFNTYAGQKIKLINYSGNATEHFVLTDIDGYYLSEDGYLKENWIDAPANAVARIDNEFFTDLPSAVSAAEDGDIVHILKDIELSSALSWSYKTITLAAYGKNVTISVSPTSTMDTLFSIGYGGIILGTSTSDQYIITIDGSRGSGRVGTCIHFGSDYNSYTISINAGHITNFNTAIDGADSDYGWSFSMGSGMTISNCGIGLDLNEVGATVGGIIRDCDTGIKYINNYGGSLLLSAEIVNSNIVDIEIGMLLLGMGEAHISVSDTLTYNYTIKVNSEGSINQYIENESKLIITTTKGGNFICLNTGYYITADGYLKSIPSDKVAMVNGVLYSTLEDAVSAASAEDIIYILKDITLADTLTIDKALTFAAYNKNVTVTGKISLNVNSGSSGTETLTLGLTTTDAYQVTYTNNGSESIISLNGNYASGDAAVKINKATLDGDGGVGITGSVMMSVYLNGGIITNCSTGIYSGSDESYIVIRGGTISNCDTGVYITGSWYAGFRMNGGTITDCGIGVNNQYIPDDESYINNIQINGGAIDNSTITDIRGIGTVTFGDDITDVYNVALIDSEITRYANSSDKLINANVTIANHFVVTGIEGYYITEDGYLREAVARIGTKSYGSLQDAVSSATSGATIYILRDITLTEAINIDKDLTIAADTKDVTISGPGIIPINGAMLTIGSNTTDTYKITFNSPLSFTSENVNSDNSGITVNSAIINTIFSQASTPYSVLYGLEVIINGGTISSISGDGSTIEVNGGSVDSISLLAESYNASLAINGGSVNSVQINNQQGYEASLSISGGTVGIIDAPAVNTLSISGGTITGNIDFCNSYYDALLEISGGTIQGNISLDFESNYPDYNPYNTFNLSGGTINGKIIFKSEEILLNVSTALTNTYIIKCNSNTIRDAFLNSTTKKIINTTTEGDHFIYDDPQYIITADGYLRPATKIVTLSVNNPALGQILVGSTAQTSVELPIGTTYTISDNVLTFSNGTVLTASVIDTTGYTTVFDNWTTVGISNNTISDDCTIMANFSRDAITTTITADVTQDNAVYGYNAFDVATISASGGGDEWTYALLDNSEYFELSNTSSTTGSVTLRFKAGAGANTYTTKVSATSKYTGETATTDVITVTINKAGNTTTISANTLTYKKTAQALVSASNVIGTVYYSLSDLNAENYTSGSTTIPTAVNADTYIVYYFVAGGDNHVNIDDSIDVTIAKKSIDLSSVYSVTWESGVSSYARTYNTGLDEITLTYVPHTNSVGTYAYSATAGNGKYTLTISSTNYTASANGNFVINATAGAELTIADNVAMLFGETKNLTFRSSMAGTMAISIKEGTKVIAINSDTKEMNANTDYSIIISNTSVGNNTLVFSFTPSDTNYGITTKEVGVSVSNNTFDVQITSTTLTSVSWSCAAIGGVAPNNYTVELLKDGSTVKSYNTTNNSYDFKNDMATGSYSFRVTANSSNTGLVANDSASTTAQSVAKVTLSAKDDYSTVEGKEPAPRLTGTNVISVIEGDTISSYIVANNAQYTITANVNSGEELADIEYANVLGAAKNIDTKVNINTSVDLEIAIKYHEAYLIQNKTESSDAGIVIESNTNNSTSDKVTEETDNEDRPTGNYIAGSTAEVVVKVTLTEEATQANKKVYGFIYKTNDSNEVKTELATDGNVFTLTPDTEYHYTINGGVQVTEVEVKLYEIKDVKFSYTVLSSLGYELGEGETITLMSADGFSETVDADSNVVALYSTTWTVILPDSMSGITATKLSSAFVGVEMTDNGDGTFSFSLT